MPSLYQEFHRPRAVFLAADRTEFEHWHEFV
jgi:hypothetical protein